MFGITYGNSYFVYVCQSASIFRTSDGDNTVLQGTTTGTSHDMLGVTFGKNIFVAVGNSGTILTNSDAYTWASWIAGTTQGFQGFAYKE